MIFDGRVEIASRGAHYVLTRVIGLQPEEEARRLSPSLAASKVDAWCDDATTWPSMFALFELLAGPTFQAPTSVDINASIKPRLRRALEDGHLVAVESSPFGQSSTPKADGVHVKSQKPEKPEPPLPPPASRRKQPPPKALHSFAIRIVDELGGAVSDVPLSFSHGGSKDDETTDGNGVARLDDSAATLATAKIGDAKTLRKALRARWDKARGDRKWLDEDQGVTVVRFVAGALPSFDLAADKLRIVSFQPARPRVRLVGMSFDTDKTFLLPSAVPGIRAIRRQYDLHPDANLLVVGHADTSGRDEHNLKLSLERADAIAAFLTDKADAWAGFYEDNQKHTSKTWGTREVQLMLATLPEEKAPYLPPAGVDGVDGPQTRAAVRAFQQAKGLKVDGIAGPVTRKALIADYMALQNTSLPAGITLTTHGCGENFPVAETTDGQRSPDDRRAEVFFFDGLITPPPPGKTSKKGSTEYPQWVARVTETIDVQSADDADTLDIVRIRLLSPFGEPMGEAKYELSVGSTTRRGVADADGWLVEGGLQLPARGQLRWGPKDAQPSVDLPDPLFLEADLTLAEPEPSPADQLDAHLGNLSYGAFESPTTAKKRFQQNFRTPEGPTGADDDVRKTLKQWLNGETPPTVAVRESLHIATGIADLDYVPAEKA